MMSNLGRVRSLLSLCVDEAVQCLEHNIDTLEMLPPNLKSRLLAVACKRGSVSSDVLECLLHKNVKILDLSECNVSDDSIRLIHKCRYLEKLDLNPGRNQTRDITSAALLDLFPAIPYLSNLYLRRCTAVTDQVTASIASSCPALTELDVGGCVALTDESLKMLSNLKNLCSLNISHSQASDEGILALVQGDCGKSLEELHLENCLHVTDFAIEAIVLHCNNLKILIFDGCPVSDASRIALETLLAKSKVKHLSWSIY
ncbi:protein AMN1 homolog [Periplaneta americana]|uniref:protein AMN1 homolog n=1 Tax=Periplaneta americana TaxID=6978 RepID=UPI0037E6FA05